MDEFNENDTNGLFLIQKKNVGKNGHEIANGG